jgi:hypothetical protein
MTGSKASMMIVSNADGWRTDFFFRTHIIWMDHQAQSLVEKEKPIVQ